MDIDKANKMAIDLMKRYRLFRSGWRFSLFRSRISFGRCLYLEKHILLSIPFVRLNSEAHVRDTILHEIAHALCGGKHSHDRVWERTARKIGCDGRRFFDSRKVKAPPKPFVGVCPECGTRIERFRRSGLFCRPCCVRHNRGRNSMRFLFIWHRASTLASYGERGKR